MWHVGGGGPDPEFVRRMHPPENEIPVALPLTAVLARTDDVAVALLGLQVHTTGLTFTVTVRARPSGGVSTRDLSEFFFHHRGELRERFLFGLEFSDGRRVVASEWGPPQGDDDVVLTGSGGSGGDSVVDQSWWLSPLPPEGPLRVVVRCVELGIEETTTELDGTAIRRAAADVVELWPWEPPRFDDRPPSPPPPDVPGDSWFAR